MLSQEIKDWNITQLIKFVRDIFEKDPPIQLSKLTVEELRVLSKLTVDERASWGSIKDFYIGRPDAPAFQNGWTNYGSSLAPASYWKDGFGVVHLVGEIKDGTPVTTAFTLPPGFRPRYNETFAVDAELGHGYVAVYTDGAVVPEMGGTDWVSLSGITFRAA